MKKYMIPPHHFDESEAEQRNLTPKCGTPMVAGDLSALRFNKVQSFCPPYRHIPPLEMTMPAGAIGHTCGVRVHRVRSLTLIVPPLAVARELDSQGAAGD